MNAAIRAVARCSIAQGWEVYGVHQGYAGLIDGDFRPMTARSVGGILQLGGTILGSARSPEFKTEEGRLKALWELRQKEIDAVVVIGGNGSQTGAHALSQMGFPVVGVASTIDNDLLGSDITIGVDTALNIALEAIDRLKTTASSHQRAFLVEVMGRNCGYLALMAGIAGGAEVVLLPEIPWELGQVTSTIQRGCRRGKRSYLIVVAEGAAHGETLAKQIEDATGQETRATVLGHVQRGGTPSAADRVLASQLGSYAVRYLRDGTRGVLIGEQNFRITTTPLEEVWSKDKPLDPEQIALVDVLGA